MTCGCGVHGQSSGQLALLFARRKKNDTHLHVTATGLATDDSNVYVIVAKNGGLDGDEDFRARLQDWFRSKNQSTSFDCRAVVDFWKDRLNFYIKQFKQVDSKWTEIQKHKRRIVHARITVGQDVELVEAEWIEVEKIRSKCTNLASRKDLYHDTLLQALYSFWQRRSRQDYRGPLVRLESKSTDESLKDYLKLIKFLELLAMPEAIWRAIQKFQAEVTKMRKVHIVPVQKVDLETQYNIPEQQLHNHAVLDPVALVETLKGWAGDQVPTTSALLDAKILCCQHLRSKEVGSPNGQHLLKLKSELERYVQDELARLDGSNKPEEITKRQYLDNVLRSTGIPRIHKYLHCELQILMILQQVQDQYKLELHRFIGCSKLSCYMCWEMLKSSHYRTRGTHGNIYSFWAFPFPKTLPNLPEHMESLASKWARYRTKAGDMILTALEQQQRPRDETVPAHTAVFSSNSKSSQRKLAKLLRDVGIPKVTLSKDDGSIPTSRQQDCPDRYQFFPDEKPRPGGFAVVHAAMLNKDKLQARAKALTEDDPQAQVKELAKDDPPAQVTELTKKNPRARAKALTENNPRARVTDLENMGERRKVVAIKEVAIGDNTKKLQAVLSELRLLKAIKECDNVVNFNKVYFTRDPVLTVFLVVSPWTTESLGDFLEDPSRRNRSWCKPSPYGSRKQWERIAKGCLRGLQFLHKHAIIHDDLKPHNILLALTHSAPVGSVRAVITDYNISRGGGNSSIEVSLVGTREYMAPERQVSLSSSASQSQSLPLPSSKTDIWSLGCCFALIVLFLHSGENKLREFWSEAREPRDSEEDRGFHNKKSQHDLDKLERELEDELAANIKTPGSKFAKNIVLVTLLKMVMSMLATKSPEARPEAKTLLAELEAKGRKEGEVGEAEYGPGSNS